MRFSNLLAVAIFASAIAAPALAEKAADKKAADSVLPQYKAIGGNPGPQYNYVCPNTDGKGGLDCYFDAVQHLYTMCRHIKSIEVIEFGYEKSEEGVNGAKSEYCVDKQKLNITRPYQAALREASISTQAVEGVRSLQEFWLDALVKLSRDQDPRVSSSAYQAVIRMFQPPSKAAIDRIREALSSDNTNQKLKPGESDDEYKARVVLPYDDFRVRIDGIRKIVSIVKENTTPPQKPERDKKQRRRI